MIKMDIFSSFILFVAGIAVLIKASDVAVDLSLKFSEITGMMKLSVGMIIIGTMTSLPEFAIAMTSSIANANQIMFGNLVGGSFTDLFFVMGIGAVLYGLRISKEDLRKGVEIFIITSGLLVYGLFWGFDSVFGLMAIILFILFSESLLSGKNRSGKNKTRYNRGVLKILIKISAAVALIVLAAEAVTYSTKAISAEFGIAESLIGATIIALSTTAPELCVTIAAGRKNEFDLLVGNLFGSCFVNIALIMGISAVIAPISFGLSQLVLVAALLGAYFTVYLFSANRQIDRFQGIILLSMYALYLIVMVTIA